MTQSPPTVPTVGEIARREGVPIHRVEYALRKLGIRPAGRAGAAYIYTEADVEKVVAELHRIKGGREGDRD
jgi:hypothetical protein